MIEKAYINPEIAGSFTPKLDGIVASNSFRRAIQIKNAISQTSEELGMHPIAVLANLRVAQAETAEQAIKIDRERIHRYAYVGDIHGFTEEKMAELSDTLLNGNFTGIFFIGDIGGSKQMETLQKLFYQGSTVTGESLLWNRYKVLQGENADEQRILSELRQGFVNIHAYERTLVDPALSLSEAREQVLAYSDDKILEGIRRVVKHKHYGHYLSDLPDVAIDTLAGDAKANYLRFVDFVKNIEYKTGAEIFALEGNWDARLPFDFERNTEVPVALSMEKRRLLASQLLIEKGVNFINKITAIENGDSMHVLLPFDPLMQDLSAEEMNMFRKQVALARGAGKQVRLIAHGVPSWEMHGNLTPTGEGKTTANNLMLLIANLDPDEVIYGHEHYLRKDEGGQLMSSDAKYRIVIKDGIAVAEDIAIGEISKIDRGTIASPVPMSNELIKAEGKEGSLVGVSETLIDNSHDHNLIRGRGGKASPVRVNRTIAKFDTSA